MDFIKNLLAWFQGKRTYIIAAGSVIGLWFGVYSGSVTFHDALEGTMVALGLSSLRAGVKNDIKNS